jgi:hypothetical protein
LPRRWATDAQARTNLLDCCMACGGPCSDPDWLIRTDSQTIHWAANGPFEFDVAAFEAALDEAGKARGTDDISTAQSIPAHTPRARRSDSSPSG